MSPSAMSQHPLKDIHDSGYTQTGALLEVLRQSERHIDDQHKLASSADQRAIAFSAVIMVVMGLMIEGAGKPPFEASQYLLLFFLISVCVSLYSARPVKMFGSGSDGLSLADFLSKNQHGYIVGAMIERNDKNIAHNYRTMKRAGQLFSYAMLIALLASLLLVGDFFDLGQLIFRKPSEEQ